jgi:hypothetical protein
MHGSVDLCISDETFQYNFIDFYINKKTTLKNRFLYASNSAKNLRERTIGILNAGMTMHLVALNIGCPTQHLLHCNTPGTHNNRLSAKTVRNRLREGGLH